MIVQEAGTACTAQISKRLKRLAYTAYYADFELYLTAVGGKQIDARPSTKKRTLDSFLTVQEQPLDAELAKLQKAKQSQEREVSRLRLLLASARTSLEFRYFFPVNDGR